jgi:hypothetical protein
MSDLGKGFSPPTYGVGDAVRLRFGLHPHRVGLVTRELSGGHAVRVLWATNGQSTIYNRGQLEKVII